MGSAASHHLLYAQIFTAYSELAIPVVRNVLQCRETPLNNATASIREARARCACALTAADLGR